MVTTYVLLFLSTLILFLSLFFLALFFPSAARSAVAFALIHLEDDALVYCDDDCVPSNASTRRLGRTTRCRSAIRSDEQVRCCFCLSEVEVGDEVRELKCNHLFHRLCLDKWIAMGKMNCPLCRGWLVKLSSDRVKTSFAGFRALELDLLELEGMESWST